MDDNIDIKKLLKEAKKFILSSDLDIIHKGLKVLKKVIKSDPENAWAFIYYGVGASKSDKHMHEALKAFGTAANICPDSMEAWKGLRSCLEVKIRSDHENQLLMNAYSNILRLENNEVKWNDIFSEIVAYLTNVSCSYLANVLSCLIEDVDSNSFKHKIASQSLSDLTFNNENLLQTNMKDVLKGFISWSKYLDFMDRPDFCKKVCIFFCKNSYFGALSSFLHTSISFYGLKMYSKLQILEYLIAIASDSLYNVEQLIPLVSDSLKEIENVKIFPQIRLALCIISYYEQDFSFMRESLENLSCSGDITASILLLKFLCKAKDYESVLFLCTKFVNVFSNIKNEKFKFEFIICLMEALSLSNELTFLHYGLKLGLKALSKYGEDNNLVYYLSHIYIGLCDSRAIFYVNKLTDNSESKKYILSLLHREVADYPLDSERWVISALSLANQDLIKGNIKRALKSFTKIGVKDKCLSDPFLILGMDSISKGDVVKAAMCFHRAFSLRPLDSQILKHYLDSLFKLADEEQALKVLDSVWASNFGKWHFIGEKALFASGLIHSAKNNHENSILCFKHLLKLNPEYSEFVEAISNEYIKLGRLGIAENYVSRLVCNDPYDLHSLLLLSQIYKFDANFALYFNQSIRCLNFQSVENRETEKISKLVLCFFINFLRHISKLEESSLSYLSKFCLKSLMNINNIATKGMLARRNYNEYLVALYIFIESHLFAALKIIKCKDKEVEANTLFQFCIKALGRVFEVFGASYISFWKLLGDVLLFSSHLLNELNIMSWLVNDGQAFDSGPNLNVSSIDRINLSIKCYTVGLQLSKDKYPKRIHEFYYDISVALVYLFNHSEIVNPEIKHYCLISSLEACLKSFKHSDGISDSRWIHSNQLGIIVSLLGIKENMFKEHFSNQELRLTEGIILQNYATHLGKSGLYNSAEEMFEQARLRVDIDYSSSWVGQLLMQLINKDIETKKMLQYHLTQIGQHSLLKWILAYFLAQHKPTLDFHGGQYSMLKYIFPEQHCIAEVNPCRLTIMGYIHEQIGNLPFARRLYFRSLRLAKFVDEDTYNIFLGNAIRLNTHCRENCELIRQLENTFSSNAMGSLFIHNLNHLSLPNVNRLILRKALILMKGLVNNSSNEDNVLKLVIPLLCLLTDFNLLHHTDVKVPYLLEYMYKNVKSLRRFGKKEFRRLLSSMDNPTRDLFFKNTQKTISLNMFGNDVGCLISDHPVIPFVERSAGKIVISNEKKSNSICNYSMTSLVQIPATEQNTKDTNVDHVSSSNTTRLISTSEISDHSNEVLKKRPVILNPYSKVMNQLRNTIFPLPLTDEEKMIIRRNKLLKLHQTPENHPKPIEIQGNSYLNVIEDHGCHSTCQFLVTLLQKSVNAKDHAAALNYALVCLNIRCCSCMLLNKMLPLICYISVETSNVKLMQKAFHLYPSDPLLRKTIFWFKSKIIL